MTDDPLQSPLLAQIVKVPPSVPEEDRRRISAEAARVYREEIVPAWRRLHGFLTERYLPGAREDTAAGA